MAIINFLIFVSVISGGLALLFKSREWALRMQRYYIRESGFLLPSLWASNWGYYMCRAMFVVIGLSFLIAAYPIAFGTVHIQF
jgi:hypothetical protein